MAEATSSWAQTGPGKEVRSKQSPDRMFMAPSKDVRRFLLWVLPLVVEFMIEFLRDSLFRLVTCSPVTFPLCSQEKIMANLRLDLSTSSSRVAQVGENRSHGGQITAHGYKTKTHVVNYC